MTNSMHGITLRCIGFARACFNSGLTNLVYNLCRYEFLCSTRHAAAWFSMPKSKKNPLKLGVFKHFDKKWGQWWEYLYTDSWKNSILRIWGICKGVFRDSLKPMTFSKSIICGWWTRNINLKPAVYSISYDRKSIAHPTTRTQGLKKAHRWPISEMCFFIGSKIHGQVAHFFIAIQESFSKSSIGCLYGAASGPQYNP